MNATDNIILFTTVLSVLNVGGVEKRQYRGVVRHNRTVRLPEIVKNAATKHGVQEGLLMYYATILFGEIGDSVLTGHRVEIDDFGSLHLTASGTFSAANAPWDAALHRMGVSIAAKGKLKAAAGVLSGKNVTEGNHVILKRVVDNLCGLENVITNTANVQVFISGDSMLITEGAEDEGVWLENERGEVVAKATVAGSTTTTVDCTFGTLPIEDGDYKIVVAARGGLGMEMGVSLASRIVKVKTANG